MPPKASRNAPAPSNNAVASDSAQTVNCALVPDYITAYRLDTNIITNFLREEFEPTYGTNLAYNVTQGQEDTFTFMVPVRLSEDQQTRLKARRKEDRRIRR